MKLGVRQEHCRPDPRLSIATPGSPQLIGRPQVSCNTLLAAESRTPPPPGTAFRDYILKSCHCSLVVAFPSLTHFSPHPFWVVPGSTSGSSCSSVVAALSFIFSVLSERFVVLESTAVVFTVFAANRNVVAMIVLRGAFQFVGTSFTLFPTLSSAVRSIRRWHANVARDASKKRNPNPRTSDVSNFKQRAPPANAP